MRFPQIPESLSALSDDELEALHGEAVAAFNDATAEGVTINDEDVAELATLTEGVEKIRTEQGARTEALAQAQAEAEAAEAARAETLADLASRVNAAVDADAVEGEEDAEGEEEEVPVEAEEPAETEEPAEAPAEAVEERVAVSATGTKAKAVTAGATVAQLKRNAPIKTRPRAEAPESTVTITAAVDVPGLRAGQELSGIRQVAEAMCERFRTIGTGNGDAVQVARFNSHVRRIVASPVT